MSLFFIILALSLAVFAVFVYIGRSRNLRATPMGTYRSLDEALKNPSKATTLLLDNETDDPISISLEGIRNLNKLEVLKISGYALPNLSSEICKLSQLRQLFIESPKPVTLPESMEQLSQLKYLKMSCQQVEFPSGIFSLESLQQLDLSHNKFTELPSGIDRLSNLQSLNLSFNQLHTLSDNIGNLSHLQYIDFSQNPIAQLPIGVGRIKALQKLDLRNTKLNTSQLGLLREELPDAEILMD